MENDAQRRRAERYALRRYKLLVEIQQMIEEELLVNLGDKDEKQEKSWNGKRRCIQEIKRMPYHKENNPTCKLPCLLGSDYCRLHHEV